MPYWAGLIVVIGALYVGWRTFGFRPFVSDRKPQPAREPARTRIDEVAKRRPTLPDGVENAIVAALRVGDAPDEAWMAEGTARILARGRFQPIAGESFVNSDGVSRQSVLAAT